METRFGDGDWRLEARSREGSRQKMRTGERGRDAILDLTLTHCLRGMTPRWRGAGYWKIVTSSCEDYELNNWFHHFR